MYTRNNAYTARVIVKYVHCTVHTTYFLGYLLNVLVLYCNSKYVYLYSTYIHIDVCCTVLYYLLVQLGNYLLYKANLRN